LLQNENMDPANSMHAPIDQLSNLINNLNIEATVAEKLTVYDSLIQGTLYNFPTKIYWNL